MKNSNLLYVPWILITGFAILISITIYMFALAMHLEGLIGVAQAFAQSITQNTFYAALLRCAWMLCLSTAGGYMIAITITKLSNFLYIKFTGENLFLK